ncbi:hypothetical protein FSZ31_03915 [Sphingorhabdus soli]|uniref:Uncharacterized protein n=1 Tax=Flavisphingopyxis soli TaxID=2601267 RepID=A0A5C6UMX5_9SPHN|nr:hypothetical protein [Sphingorhabdus soli]TXC73880.1 hypothetical protein FSZ31_03915 [Sphingorhabdus soli]
MATNSGDGHRTGSVAGRTQVRNPATGHYTKRNRDPGSPGNGAFMDTKSDTEPFKGVAREPDGRRS